MLWTQPARNWNGSFWDDMGRLRAEMDRLFEPMNRSSLGLAADFPAVNVWTSTDDALLAAELPGVDPKDIEVTVKHDIVTIKGDRKLPEPEKGQTIVRSERGGGSFSRSFSLPFHVDGDKVEAHYRMGILQLRLPRAEADKPKRIAVNAG